MITRDQLRIAARVSPEGIRLLDDWVGTRAWVVRVDELEAARIEKQAGAGRSVEADVCLRGWLALPRVACTEDLRGVAWGDNPDTVRRYIGGGVYSFIQEPLAQLLDGLSVVRLGEGLAIDIHAGVDAAGEIQVVVMPVRPL